MEMSVMVQIIASIGTLLFTVGGIVWVVKYLVPLILGRLTEIEKTLTDMPKNFVLKDDYRDDMKSVEETIYRHQDGIDDISKRVSFLYGQARGGEQACLK